VNIRWESALCARAGYPWWHKTSQHRDLRDRRRYCGSASKQTLRYTSEHRDKFARRKCVFSSNAERIFIQYLAAGRAADLLIRNCLKQTQRRPRFIYQRSTPYSTASIRLPSFLLLAFPIL
jgi:hypothetical protein